MMAFCRWIARCAYWLAVIALSVGTWWFVHGWLEPRPVWTVPVDDPLQLTHYQPKERLLTGYRYRSNDQMELVVNDATTGQEKAWQLVSNEPVPIPESNQYIDIRPRLVGDAVMRFTNVKLATGEHEVQLRSW